MNKGTIVYCQLNDRYGVVISVGGSKAHVQYLDNNDVEEIYFDWLKPLTLELYSQIKSELSDSLARLEQAYRQV